MIVLGIVMATMLSPNSGNRSLATSAIPMVTPVCGISARPVRRLSRSGSPARRAAKPSARQAGKYPKPDVCTANQTEGTRAAVAPLLVSLPDIPPSRSFSGRDLKKKLGDDAQSPHPVSPGFELAIARQSPFPFSGRNLGRRALSKPQ